MKLYSLTEKKDVESVSISHDCARLHKTRNNAQRSED